MSVSDVKATNHTTEGRLGSDSHADISCAGKHARILEYIHGQTCTVHPFHDSYEPKKDINICNAAFAYDDTSGETIILKMNQCLDFSESMEHSLFCSNQVRSNGIIVDDIPRSIDVRETSKQALIFPSHDSYEIPFKFKGPVPFIPVRKPSEEEMEKCRIFDITNDYPWNPEYFMSSPSQEIDAISVVTWDSATHEPTPSDALKSICDQMHIHAINMTSRKDTDPLALSKLWNISLDNAKRTIKSSEQDKISAPSTTLSRRRRVGRGNQHRKVLHGFLSKFCSDTFKSNVKSLRGNQYVQLFSNRGNFVYCYPMERKGEASDALHRFIDEVGIPSEILSDGAPELSYAGWRDLCRTYQIIQRKTEPESPWQNPAELAGGIMKRKVRRIMKATSTPVRLWDYCWEYCSQIRNFTATDHRILDDSTPYEKNFGHTPNISEYIQHRWYDWIWYYDTKNPFRESLGRWLGPAKHCGNSFTSHILTKKGKVIVRSTTRPISQNEIESQSFKKECDEFTKEMHSLIGNSSTSTISNHSCYEDDPYTSMFEGDEQDDEAIELIEPGESSGESPHVERDDEHIGVALRLPKRGELKDCIVKNRKRNSEGLLIGKSHPNPQCDTRMYEVMFDDGSTSNYSANTIMENLWQQSDEDGRFGKLFKGISNHRKDDSAVPKQDGWITLENNIRKRKITTKGWDLLVDWSNGTQSWLPLNLIKESNPIDVAEYAVANAIHEEPAFIWWVSKALKKRKHYISKLRSVIRNNQLKYGLKVPRTVKEALEIDLENGNSHWADAIKKELGNVLVAFKLLEDDEPIPTASTKIPYHIIFDVKFDLTRKARLVAGGHKHKDVPAFECYSSVASRETIRIAFLLATVNKLKLLAADIGNAYLNAPCREKVHVTVGPELFGQENEGKTAVIVRALYGLRSAGASWRAHLSSMIINDLGYRACKADQDIYMKRKVRKDGSKYYAYLVIYVDDILCVDEEPEKVIDSIGSHFRIKDGSVSEPKTYLGSTIRKWTGIHLNGDSFETYAMGSSGYVKEAIRIVEERMKEYQLKYPVLKAKTPFTSSAYRPELESSTELDTKTTTLYQNFIGILRWICELGRLDILLEVNLMSQYMVSPRTGHLNQLLNIFCYLKHHHRSWLVFNPDKFDIEWVPIRDELCPSERALLMKRLYPDATEVNPPGMPEPLGDSLQFTLFVDANHAGNRVTRRSQTGIIVFANMTPIIWISKKQNTVESSTFGSEFLALKHACEMMKGLLYKVKMLGVPIDGPTRVLCDNQSVVINGSFPESVLKKKHCSVAYHIVRETVAAGTVEIYWEETNSNLADLFTKVLPEYERNKMVQAMLS